MKMAVSPSKKNCTMNHPMLCGIIPSTIYAREMGEFKPITTAYAAERAAYNLRGPASKVDALFKLLSSPFYWGSSIATQYRTLLDQADILYDNGLIQGPQFAGLF